MCGRYKRRLGSNINDNLADDAMLLAGNIEQLCSLYRALSELRVFKIYQ